MLPMPRCWRYHLPTRPHTLVCVQEFLMGRSLLNALNNLDVVDQYKEALTELGYKLETLVGGMGGNAGNTSPAS